MVESVALESSSTTVPEAAEVEISQHDECSRISRFRHFYDRLSQSRQIFCLFCIFDFLFTFFLWIIYAQVWYYQKLLVATLVDQSKIVLLLVVYIWEL